LPNPERWHAALSCMYDRRQRKGIITLILKLLIHSTKQEKNLRDCFVYVSQLTDRVLEALREDPGEERPDGAFALVLEMLDQRAAKGEKASDRSTTLGNLIGKYFNQRHLIPDDYYYSVKLREGVYREAARAVLNWCSTFLSLIPTEEIEDTPEHQSNESRSTMHQPSSLSLRALYQAWRAYLQAYKVALETPCPFGRNKGKPLKTVGRRDLRWLLERLLPEDVTRETIYYLEILLGIREARDTEEAAQATLAEHPYRRVVKHKHSVRERRLDTRMYDPPGDRILLESLSTEELERLYDELLDQQAQRAKYEEVRDAVETILFRRPPRFPSVATVVPIDDDVAVQDALRDYWATLDRFRSPFPSRPSKPLDEYSMDELEELEAEARDRMLRAGSALELPQYQPLSFKRSMRPRSDGLYSAYGFLRDRATGAYVLALALGGRKSRQRPNSKKPSTKQGLDHFTPHVGENLEFYNFPVPFRPHPDSSIMLCSLQYDEEYHHRQYLQPLYERILATPADEAAPDVATTTNTYEADSVSDVNSEVEAMSDGRDVTKDATANTYEADSVSDVNSEVEAMSDGRDVTKDATADGQKLRKRVKRAPIGSARVVCRWTTDGQPEFYLHLPVPMFEVSPPPFPQTVLGIHEHDTGYSYAVISFTGELIETGDLAIESSVQPHIGDRTYNPNYANEVAIAIIRLAKQHNAYIGIEETSQFRQANISRTRNRRFFGRPSKRIAQIVRYKAVEHGVLPPRMVWRVAPSRDCSQCGFRLDEGTSGIRRVAYVVCPACAQRQPWQADDLSVQTCTACKNLWRAHEAWVEREFVCMHCHAAPRLARINTAIVVALKTIHGTVEYYEWLRDHGSADGSASSA
jgi:hypothetical protein